MQLQSKNETLNIETLMLSWQRNICDEFGSIFSEDLWHKETFFSVQNPPNVVQSLVPSSGQRNVQILTLSLVDVLFVYLAFIDRHCLSKLMKLDH